MHLCINSLDYSGSFDSQGTFTSQIAGEKTEAKVIASSKVTQLVSVRTRPLAPGFWLQVREPSIKCILTIVQTPGQSVCPDIKDSKKKNWDQAEKIISVVKRKFTLLVKPYPDDKLLWNNIKMKRGVFLKVLFSRKFSECAVSLFSRNVLTNHLAVTKEVIISSKYIPFHKWGLP